MEQKTGITKEQQEACEASAENDWLNPECEIDWRGIIGHDFTAAYRLGFQAAQSPEMLMLNPLVKGLVKAAYQVSDNQFLQYGHGCNGAVSDLTHQYKMGVTDGHRLAKTWIDKALAPFKEVDHDECLEEAMEDYMKYGEESD